MSGTAEDIDARFRAHDVFDRLWRRHGWHRPTAYRWLALRLGIHEDRCHFAMFDAARCYEVIEIVRRELPNLRVTQAALKRGRKRHDRRPRRRAPEVPMPRPRCLADAVDGDPAGVRSPRRSRDERA